MSSRKKNVPRTKADKGTLRRVLNSLKPYRGAVVLSIILSALCAALTLYVPILVGRAIDLIIEAGRVDFTAIIPILLRIGVVVTATAVAQWLINVLNNRITCAVVRDVREHSV